MRSDSVAADRAADKDAEAEGEVWFSHSWEMYRASQWVISSRSSLSCVAGIIPPAGVATGRDRIGGR